VEIRKPFADLAVGDVLVSVLRRGAQRPIEVGSRLDAIDTLPAGTPLGGPKGGRYRTRVAAPCYRFANGKTMVPSTTAGMTAVVAVEDEL